MTRMKLFTLSIVMCLLAVLFQLIPVFLGESFIVLTILSTIPIFILSRIQPSAGLLAYIVSTFLIILVSPHESLFFMLANGLMGFTLGTSRHYLKKDILIVGISAFILTISLFFMTLVLDIPTFGGTLPGNNAVQVSVLLGFSIGYTILLLFFANYITSLFSKCRIITNKSLD